MNIKKIQIYSISAIIIAAALSRLLPHVPNATPLAAMALLGGVYLGNRALAFIIPLAALVLSDVMIGFYAGMGVVYGAFLFTVLLGTCIRRNPNSVTIASTTLISSILFFLLTNSVWLHGGHGLYAQNWNGMMECYTAALPFFRNSLLGDVGYSALLFGGYWLLQRLFPQLQTCSRA